MSCGPNEIRQNRSEHEYRGLVASPKHTVIFLAIIATLGVAGTALQFHMHSPPSNVAPTPSAAASRVNLVPMYLSLIIGEWALVRFVWKGIQAKGMKLRDLIGGSWTSARRIATDVMLAAGIWLIFRFAISIPAGHLLASRLAQRNPVNPLVLHHVTVVDAILWILVSVSAGFCEEVAFRGYLQRQFSALTGNSGVAVFLQAVVFAIGHAYEGLNAVVVIGLYALLFGLVAWWRSSLRPGMIAHAWSDIFANLLARLI